jgi:hypothetical protein
MSGFPALYSAIESNVTWLSFKSKKEKFNGKDVSNRF